MPPRRAKAESAGSKKQSDVSASTSASDVATPKSKGTRSRAKSISKTATAVAAATPKAVTTPKAAAAAAPAAPAAAAPATPKVSTPKISTPKPSTPKISTPKPSTPKPAPRRTSTSASANGEKSKTKSRVAIDGGGSGGIASKLPEWSRFPAVALTSFGLASLGYSVLGAVTNGELQARSRLQESWGEVGVLAGWRLVELAVGWFGNLDSLDVATLNLLSHGPPLYLLTTFYELSPLTAMLSFALDVASAAVPFYALRPLSAVHTRSARLPNRELAGLGLQLYTAALATAVYTVVMTLSLRFALPRALAVYFSGLPSLEPAYGASYWSLLPATVQFGAAASSFIYAPFATTGRAKDDDRIAQFDPAAASLRETVEWNFLGYTAKTKVVVGRTALAVAVTAVNTAIACRMTIYGVEVAGAVAYAAAWAVATACVGAGLAFVGGYE
ncbi:Conserved hypothetical, protein [Geosmithia morbida]|uniref:Conserved hypothetical, protein n=1 Tax=Geosmithia morbida TaxID=1094350 RepID=A0A9P5D466_9HYPO|nr:Conserved hypothetical, protein [Geosmithia morbida]KAF4121189.1 Conserved hypothetical, protein [Geosmithia morbida]